MAIKHKIALSFSLLLILVLFAFWLSLKLQLEQSLAGQTDTLGRILARQTADSVTELVLANDLLGLNVVLNELLREGGVAAVTVSNVDGVALAAVPSGTLPMEAGRPYLAAVTLQDAVAGYVSLYLDDTFVSNPVARPDALLFLIIGAGLVLVTATAYALGSHFSTPLLELAALPEPEEAGDDPEPVQVTRNDEIGLLQQRIAELYERQRELVEQLAVTGLPRDNPEEQKGLPPERRMSTVLLVQVVNSGTALELLHPATLSTLLQQFQFYLVQAARLYRGVATRVHGDSILLTFNARHCQDEHAFSALCCAQLFMRLMQRVAASQRVRHAQTLEFKACIHSGDLYYSPLWRKHRSGDDKPRRECVIGKAVELVAQLVGHCATSEILVSELSWELAGGQRRFPVDTGREVTLDTDNLVLMTYSLPPGTGAHSDLLERQCRHLIPDAAADTDQGKRDDGR